MHRSTVTHEPNRTRLALQQCLSIAQRAHAAATQLGRSPFRQIALLHVQVAVSADRQFCSHAISSECRTRRNVPGRNSATGQTDSTDVSAAPEARNHGQASLAAAEIDTAHK